MTIQKQGVVTAIPCFFCVLMLKKYKSHKIARQIITTNNNTEFPMIKMFLIIVYYN